jgi:hypothetical protein
MAVVGVGGAVDQADRPLPDAAFVLLSLSSSRQRLEQLGVLSENA